MSTCTVTNYDIIWPNTNWQHNDSTSPWKRGKENWRSSKTKAYLGSASMTFRDTLGVVQQVSYFFCVCALLTASRLLIKKRHGPFLPSPSFCSLFISHPGFPGTRFACVYLFVVRSSFLRPFSSNSQPTGVPEKKKTFFCCTKLSTKERKQRGKPQVKSRVVGEVGEKEDEKANKKGLSSCRGPFH